MNERDRDTKGDTERQTHTDIHRETEIQRHRDTQRKTEICKEKQRERHTEKARDSHQPQIPISQAYFFANPLRTLSVNLPL